MAESLKLPNNIGLPFFTYGSFKPREFAYNQIESFLSREPISGHVRGTLWIRDGLPLLKAEGTHGTVIGSLLYFQDSRIHEAYSSISRFEPKKHYNWTEIAQLRSGQIFQIAMIERE